MTKLINAHNKSAPKAAQLPHARLHDLRHLHATTLLLAGVPVHLVAARLGHADPAVTLRVYSHVLREHAAGIGDIFAQAITAPVSKAVSMAGQPGSLRHTSPQVRSGGQGRGRTADLPLFRRTLVPTELPDQDGRRDSLRRDLAPI